MTFHTTPTTGASRYTLYVDTLKPGLRTVTKHMRVSLALSDGITHFREGDTVLIEDVGPQFARVTSSERRRRVRTTVAKILAHTEVFRVARKKPAYLGEGGR